MLTITQFFNKYLNKSVEYDGVAEYQCVDLIKFYLKRHMNINPGSWGDAKQYGLKANNPDWAGYKLMHDCFIWIEGKPVPEKGDIVVFNGTYGHVGIATGNSSVKKFELVEQNWSSKKYVTKNFHFYTDVIGVWHPKKWIVTEELNIRTAPNSTIIGTYKEDTQVEVLETKHSWCRTKDGWVFKKYLD